MLNNFAKLLSSLRKEKKISQRKAAQELDISQALLSHYENGAREPGIAFIIRAADYYGVSCDYLLGRTAVREINTAEKSSVFLTSDLSLADGSNANTYAILQNRRVLSAIALITDGLSKSGSRAVQTAVSDYLAVSIYKLCRTLYSASEKHMESMLNIGERVFAELCDAELKQCEIKLKKHIFGLKSGAEAITEHSYKIPEISEEILNTQYPTWGEALMTLLKDVSEKLEKR